VPSKADALGVPQVRSGIDIAMQGGQSGSGYFLDPGRPVLSSRTVTECRLKRGAGWAKEGCAASPRTIAHKTRRCECVSSGARMSKVIAL
jgi:hypothetical protein